jgi:hypothetical protein
VRQDLVADAESRDRGPDGTHHAGGFHAQRQRRRAAHIPAANSHDLIPIADTSGVPAIINWWWSEISGSGNSRNGIGPPHARMPAPLT